jgi:hypothetical protein
MYSPEEVVRRERAAKRKASKAGDKQARTRRT